MMTAAFTSRRTLRTVQCDEARRIEVRSCNNILDYKARTYDHVGAITCHPARSGASFESREAQALADTIRRRDFATGILAAHCHHAAFNSYT
jgi:hypothetical protein